MQWQPKNMKPNPIPNTSFNIKAVFLVKSFFERVNPKINLQSIDINKITREVNVNIENEVEENILNSYVTLTYLSKFPDGQKEVECTIKMGAVFEIVGDEKVIPDRFIMVNAPAIVFPYIREHLSSLSIKAGLQAIVLPPYNFTNLKKEEK